jgi:Ca2+-binding RTX toxin-like protein
MAYIITGTSGRDTLNQTTEPGPGTIDGLAGDDSILSGTGAVTINGGSGNDTIVLQPTNAASVHGGSENDSIVIGPGFFESPAALAPGEFLLFGNEGADTIDASDADVGVTIVGGNDSADGSDTLLGSFGDDVVFGNGGDDTMAAMTGNDTYVGGVGGDLIGDFPLFEEEQKISPAFYDAGGNDLVFGNEGDDTVVVSPGHDTVFGGQGNDSIEAFGNLRNLSDAVSLLAELPGSLYFGNEGADTIAAFTDESVTIVGGNDSADGADLLFGGFSDDVIFGNGGNDSIDANEGNDTVIGGAGNDTMFICDGNNLAFGNEGNDTIEGEGTFSDTVFAGQGNDSVVASLGRDTIQGNEGNDTIFGDGNFGDTVGGAIDTISGGAGNDAFAYEDGHEDGNNAEGGGPVEWITDVNFDQDRFLTAVQVTFAANMGAGTGATLNTSANNALAATYALNGNTGVAAAQFTFGGRQYLVIDQGGGPAFAFTDEYDLLIDITGAVGTIDAGDFGLAPELVLST